MDQIDECNVFEADVSPVPTAILTGSDLEVDKNKCGNGAKANITGLRYYAIYHLLMFLYLTAP